MIYVEAEASLPANIYRIHTKLGMVLGAEDKKRTKAMVPALQELTEQTDWESIVSSG